jgi:hypothetical protein
MSATDTGAPEHDFDLIDRPISESEAEAEFLKRFLPPDAEEPSGQEEEVEKPKKKAPKEEPADEPEPEEEAEEPSAEEPEETEEEAEGEDEGEEKRKYAEDDDVYTKVKVGDEEHEVAVKDLKRLYGQEASLTKKSMEVAETRKKLDAEVAKATTATVALLENAKKRFQPYSQIDFNLAATQLSPEEYTALRTEAQAAYQDVQFLEKNLDGLMTQIRAKQEEDRVSVARESIKTLSGPVDKGGIEGWNEKLYDDIRAFAVSEGAPVETVNQLVDAWAIRLLYDAMLYKRGKTKVVTKKVNKTPTKVVKSTVTPKSSGTVRADKADAAMAKLRKSHKEDDVVDVMLARWAAGADEAE